MSNINNLPTRAVGQIDRTSVRQQQSDYPNKRLDGFNQSVGVRSYD